VTGDYPKPSSAGVSSRMRQQPSRSTGPEVALRRELHRRGLRYRLQRRVLPDVRRTADIVFGPARVVVDVRGCYWHGCAEHGTRPRVNNAYWDAKLARNRARDVDTEQRLRAAGWSVVVVWEHEDPRSAADRVQAAVEARRAPPSTGRRRCSEGL
jgi:DNA mismatch endonuclease (patch repair protein)